LGIVFNVLALVFFKYQDFFLPELNALGLTGDGLRLLLPIGLSFYIVQAIAYLMDLEKGLLAPERDPLDFALFMAYFPRLTSGPIERARDFLPKLKAPRVVDDELFARSITLILMGLFRKVAVADVLTLILPSDVFSDPGNYRAPELAIWLLAYAFALYNDFAGYSAIVRGISGLFGIELNPNFNLPYLARNMVEFWARWHISLSEWLRDYVFTPSTRALLRRKYNSRHALTIVLPPLLTMAISALWHDVSWNMLLWGGLHGVFQVGERVRSIWWPAPPPQQHPWWRQVGAMLLVFVLVSLAWVPFKTSIPDTLDYWAGLTNLSEWGAGLTLSHLHGLVFFLAGIILALDICLYRRGEFTFTQWPPLGKAIMINLAIFAIILGTAVQGDAPPPFIYQGF
jgi:D-alanyl-lipoteichoic acid acyltransferase DltB (MBOAT superfamily)